MTTSAQSTQQLVEQCQGMVRSLAIGIHRKLPPHVELDDVIAYGQVGLAEAARDFDPSRGSRFSTYAYYRVRGAIYDGLSKMAWFSRSQYQHVRYERMAGEVLHGANAPEETPHEEENLENDMRWMRDLGRALAIVYLTTHSEAKEETKEISIADSARFAPPVQAMNREIGERIRELVAMLPHDEGELIRAAYFEGVTLQEAGQRLGIGKSWATRLHAKALQRLARALRLLGVAS